MDHYKDMHNEAICLSPARFLEIQESFCTGRQHGLVSTVVMCSAAWKVTGKWCSRSLNVSTMMLKNSKTCSSTLKLYNSACCRYPNHTQRKSQSSAKKNENANNYCNTKRNSLSTHPIMQLCMHRASSSVMVSNAELDYVYVYTYNILSLVYSSS